MRFVTFQRSGEKPEPGIVVLDKVISLVGAGFTNMTSLLAGGKEARAKAERFLYEPPANAVSGLGSVKLLAPIPRPPKVICVGLNYRDHAQEAKLEIPKEPVIFSKFSNTVIGPGDPIVLPRNSRKPDYEAELVIVAGPGGRHIPEDKWRDHVFGYTIGNDVSARDFQLASSQWLLGKSFDTFAPLGPWIVGTDEIADPGELDISLSIGGEVLQKSNTREMVFKAPQLVSYISSVITLEPGDVIYTGTPSGVGFARRPPRYLRPGDEIAITIQNIGELRNPVIAET